MRPLGVAICLAGTPVATLVILALAQWADPWPAIAGIVVSLLSAVVFALVWARDQDLLTAAVRRIASDETGPVLETDSAIVLQTLGREIGRLSRRIAARAALQEKYRRADTVILERLPDPILVLARDRSIRRGNAATGSAFGDDIPAVLRHPGLRAAIDRALSDPAPQTAELGLRAPVSRDIHATVVR